jgi:tetratricopeptide (TPR) repeat protein
MPEPTLLHIGSDDSPATRVLELPGVSVRIGRGPQCEVQLSEPALAEVQCLLRRRGETWHVQPVGPSNRMTLEGRPVDMQRPLPLGVPLRVGEHWLTLRPADTGLEGPGTFHSPIPVHVEVEETRVEVAPPTHLPIAAPPLPELATAGLQVKAEGDRAVLWRERVDQHTRWLKAKQEERKWEARWKAVGARLQERATPPVKTISPSVLLPEPPPTPIAIDAPLAPTFADLEDRRRAWRPPKLLHPTHTVTTPPQVAPPEPYAVALPSLERISTRRSINTATRAPSSQVKKRSERGDEGKLEEPRLEAYERIVAAPNARMRAAPPDHPAITSRHLATSVRSEPIEPIEVTREVPPECELPTRSEVLPRLDRSREQAVARPRSSRQFEEPSGRLPQSEMRVPELGSLSPVAPSHEPVIRNPFVRDRTLPRRGQLEIDSRSTGEPASVSPPAMPTRELRPVITQNLPASIGEVTDEVGSEWPSSRVMLAAHQPRTASHTQAPRANASRSATRPQPTVAREPDSWTLPVWPACIASVAIMLLFGSVGMSLAWTWAEDDWSAGLVADRLLPEGPPPTSPNSLSADLGTEPTASWWRSTAGHLFFWALEAARDSDSPDHADQVLFLLHSARNASPMQASVRFAQAQMSSQDMPALALTESLGQSRDVVTLALKGRCLLAAGKTDAALRAFTEALDLASRAELADLDTPAFVDDAQVRRYQLPYEDLMGSAVRSMAENDGWTFSQWSTALPAFAVAPLVAARVLREQGQVEVAERALDLVLDRAREAPPPGCAAAVHCAAEAEALALRGRWSEAEERYRRAIVLMPNGVFRRSWYINLADIYIRLNDDAKKQAAWEAAKGLDSNEEITQRAILFQTQAGIRVGAAAARSQGTDSPNSPDQLLPNSLP